MLTPKQEKYVQGLHAGLSQRKAFREAYPHSRKWKDHVVDVKASQLFKNPKVFDRYNELKEEQEKEILEKNLWTYEKAIKSLLWVMQQSQFDIKDKGVRAASGKTFIDAIKELNDLQGLGEGRKTKIDVHTDTSVVIVDDI